MANQGPVTKPLQIKPLSGLMDLRSLPEEVAYGGYRWAENFTATAKDKICRRPGYQKLLTEISPYNNQDLHDQLFENTGQPIQLLFEAVSTSNTHRLIAATQNRIYALDDTVGNWRVLSDMLGGDLVQTCTERQWQAAQVEDTVVFTNGFNSPIYWTFDQPPLGANAQSVATLTDLATLNVTKVGTVYAWKGIMFLGNIVADGSRINHRILWSDFKKPLSFIPGTGSLAGFHDLGYGEDILAFKEINDSLLVYTTHGIWEIQVGDPTAEIFTFRQRFSDRYGHACLTYRNTLISTGDEHIYASRDGIYVYNLYTPTPVRTEWIHRASAAIFDEINESVCNLQYAGWNPAKKEAWFSWTKVGGTCPYRTLILNTEYQFADILQQGFTAFGNYRPSNSLSIRDYLVQECVCEPDGLDILGDDFTKEGGYCTIPTETTDCNVVYDSIFTTTAKVVIGFPNTIEDGTAPAPNPGSLYAAFGDLTLDDLCASEQASDECNASSKFIFASASDQSIKQYGGIYAHERTTGHAACGLWEYDGYDSILRSGPIDYAKASNQKFLRRFLVEVVAETQTIPSVIVPRLGFAHQPSDPNLETGCPIMWQTLPPKHLACASPKTAAQHVLDKTQPYLALEWPVYLGGRFLYWEVKVSGTGGASCYSSVTFDAAMRVQGQV